MNNLELQEYINWTLSLEVEKIRSAKHAPHLGMSCAEYERLIQEAKAEELPQT